MHDRGSRMITVENVSCWASWNHGPAGDKLKAELLSTGKLCNLYASYG